MPETSDKPIFQKLGIKVTHRAFVATAPKDVKLGPAPKGCALTKKWDGTFDFILTFCTSPAELEATLVKLKKSLNPSGMAWVGWPKNKSSGLGRDIIHTAAATAGLEGVGLISINNGWSAFKIMRPKGERTVKEIS